MPKKLFKREESVLLTAQEVGGKQAKRARLVVEAKHDGAATMLAEWAPDTQEGRDDKHLSVTLLCDQELPLTKKVYPALIIEFSHDLAMDVKEHGDRFEELYKASCIPEQPMWSAPNKNTGKTHQIHVYATAKDRDKALRKLEQMKDCRDVEPLTISVQLDTE